MGIRYFVFAVNKMDLVGYDEKVFAKIQEQIAELTKELDLQNVTIIPVSATEGDNVTVKSPNMRGTMVQALLSYLEQVDITVAAKEQAFICRYSVYAVQTMNSEASRVRLKPETFMWAMRLQHCQAMSRHT